MKHFLYILLFSNLIACNNSHTNDYSGNSKPSASPPNVEDLPGCYMKIVGRDTAILMLEQKGKKLSGKMIYDNYEKDGSRGIIKGKEEEGILKLWYDFESEGMHSITEVYFKKDNGKLLRGVGAMDAKTDTAYFLSGINYSDKEAFFKVDCGLIEWKLKF
ncbi:MAG TPA: hypothetical protein VIU35_15340 [Chitinophagaceae bacterium]